MSSPRRVEIPSEVNRVGADVELLVEDSRSRTTPQLEKLGATFQPFGSKENETPFDDRLDWAFFKGQVRHKDSSTHLLYLFNVIVALEWTPSAVFLRKLLHGLQRASDLLYDATDGQMAFGKVTIADETWMDRADIQVLASNRLLPRSWTAGLLKDDKYAPIRVGRGVWVRDRHELQDWDEANAYHTLVHEWLHYALCLRDEYLTGARPFSLDQVSSSADPGEEPQYLVLPIGGLGSSSIMATPVGHSEFSSQALTSATAPDGITNQTASITEDEVLVEQAYPGLKISGEDESERDPGPYRPPLQLPLFRLDGEFGRAQRPHLDGVLATPEYLLLDAELRRIRGDEAKLNVAGLVRSQEGSGGRARPKLRRRIGGKGPGPLTFEPESLLHSNWEVAVLRPGKEQDGPRIIAQGSLDAAAMDVQSPDFTLCGAQCDDKVLIIGGREKLMVYTGTVGDGTAWLDSELPLRRRPFVDVFPVAGEDRDPRGFTVAADPGGAYQDGWSCREFPRGHLNTRAAAIKGYVVAHDDTALDGQVLLRRDVPVDDEANLLVCSYSRGGVPPTGISSPTNPLSAGSSDGGAMIFGHAVKDPNSPEYPKGFVGYERQIKDYTDAINRTVVVTTSMPWLPDDEPKVILPVDDGETFLVTAAARRLTNVFSITTSRSFTSLDEELPAEIAAKDRLNPTLMMTFEPAALRPGEVVYLCRYDERWGANAWMPLPSRQVGQVLCGTPLNAETAPGLVFGGAAERYCLFALNTPEGSSSLAIATTSLLPVPEPEEVQQAS